MNNKYVAMIVFVVFVAFVLLTFRGFDSNKVPDPRELRRQSRTIEAVVVDTLSKGAVKFLFVIPVGDFLVDWPAISTNYYPPEQTVEGLAIITVPNDFMAKPRDVISFESYGDVHQVVQVDFMHYDSYNKPCGIKKRWFVRNVDDYQAVVRKTPLFHQTMAYSSTDISNQAGFH